MGSNPQTVRRSMSRPGTGCGHWPGSCLSVMWSVLPCRRPACLDSPFISMRSHSRHKSNHSQSQRRATPDSALILIADLLALPGSLLYLVGCIGGLGAAIKRAQTHTEIFMVIIDMQIIGIVTA